MFHYKNDINLKPVYNLAPVNALLILVLISSLFLRFFIFSYFIVLIYILFFLDRRFALKHAILIEDDQQHTFPFVDSNFNYKVFIASKSSQKLKVRFGLEQNYFANQNRSQIIKTVLNPNEMTVISLPITVNKRGRFKVYIYEVEIEGFFKLLRYKVDQPFSLSTLYASYGTYNQKNIEHALSLDETGRKVIGPSNDKYSNSPYQYDLPFHLIDFNASLKANELLVKQTEVYEANQIMLSANVLTNQHIHHKIEEILKSLSDYAHTYFEQHMSFFIAINIKTSLISDEPVVIVIKNTGDMLAMHRAIAEFNQDSYTFHFSNLVDEVLHSYKVTRWIHFGEIKDSEVMKIKHNMIHFERGEIDAI